jgi:UDP-glucose 4-epimerase
VRRFVFMSSGGAIYGETTEPATESTLPSPRSHYGLNKFAAEQIVRAEAISHAILRPSNIFGPGQRSDLEGGVVAIFVERLLRGEPVELHGNGQQRRDFVHVSDVVSAVELALRVHDDVIWNVASGRSIQIVELLKTLARLTGAGTGLQRMPRRPGDVRTSALSAALLRSRGWGPPLGLQAGLELLLAEEAGGTAIDKTFSGSVVC